MKVAVAHEDFEHVREVVTQIPPTAEQTERVSLSVKMTPAQGNARIESQFRKRNSFGTQIVEVGLIVKERIGEVNQP